MSEERKAESDWRRCLPPRRVVTVFLLGLFFIALDLPVLESVLTTDWATTVGRVEQSEIVSRPHEQDGVRYYLDLSFSYEVEARTYGGQRISPGENLSLASLEAAQAGDASYLPSKAALHGDPDRGLVEFVATKYPVGAVLPVYYDPIHPGSGWLDISPTAGNFKGITFGIVTCMVAVLIWVWSMMQERFKRSLMRLRANTSVE